MFLSDEPPQCPIDTRKALSENLVIIGGTAMLPGFLHRLLAEIRLLVDKPKYPDALATKSFRLHSPPAKPNCTAWLGGERQSSLITNLVLGLCMDQLGVVMQVGIHQL